MARINQQSSRMADRMLRMRSWAGQDWHVPTAKPVLKYRPSATSYECSLLQIGVAHFAVAVKSTDVALK